MTNVFGFDNVVYVSAFCGANGVHFVGFVSCFYLFVIAAFIDDFEFRADVAVEKRYLGVSESVRIIRAECLTRKQRVPQPHGFPVDDVYLGYVRLQRVNEVCHRTHNRGIIGGKVVFDAAVVDESDNRQTVFVAVIHEVFDFVDDFAIKFYAVFTVDPTEIDEDNYKVKGAHQGNFVIALRVAAPSGITVDGTNWPQGTIIWSWHIWVTDNPMTPVTVKTKGSTVATSNDMMPYHLGWCDEKVYKNTRYKTRTWYVKATQSSGEPTPKSKVFKVIQNGDNILEQIRWSGSTCYQWGRKDPLLPGYNAFTGTSYGGMLPDDFHPTNKPWSSPSGYTIVGSEGYAASAAMDLTQMIRNPHLFSSTGINYYNLWNSNAATTMGVDRAVVKTVYDPCPPGYSLPHKWAFSNFNKNGTSAQIGVRNYEDTNAADINGDGVLDGKDFLQEDGWHFYTGNGNETMFFPATCARVDAAGYIRYFHVAYLWTACRQNETVGGNGGFDLYYDQSGSEAWISGYGHALTVHPVVGN